MATRAAAAASSRSSPPPPISAGSGEGGGRRPLPHGGGATTKETASADNVRRSSGSASATAASRRNGAGTRRSTPGQNDRSCGGTASAADRNATSAGAAATTDPSTTASSRKRGRQNGTATATATATAILSALSGQGNARRVMDDFEFCIDVFDLLASGHVFGDEEVALSLFKTHGVLKYFEQDLNHCLGIICELSELLDNRLDLVAKMLTKTGVLGALFSNTVKALEGVELHVKKCGPDSAVTSLGSSSRILRSYIRNSKFPEVNPRAKPVKQTTEELEAIQRAKLAAKQRAPTKSGDTYSAVFLSRESGLDMVQVDFKGSLLTLVSKADGTFCMCNGRPIKSDTLIRRNDVLLSVAGKRVVGSPMNEVEALMSSSPRPVTLKFRAKIR